MSRAREEYGTEIPWLADTIENDLKHAFGNRNNSEFVISPEGEVLIARAWSNPETLRKDLEELVGKPETLTEPPHIPRDKAPDPESKIARGVVERVPRPSGAQPLEVGLASNNDSAPTDPVYLKLRAESSPALLRNGSGPLHLAFYLDPIHEVHWNNLAAPLRYNIIVPEGMTISSASGESTKVEKVEADRDPREFLIDIDRGERERDTPLSLEVTYFPCDDQERWCKAVTQTFTIAWAVDRDAGRVQVRGGRGSTMGGGKGRPGRGQPDPMQILTRLDKDEDGKISREEARGPIAERFDQVDKDGDGFVSDEELKARFEGI